MKNTQHNDLAQAQEHQRDEAACPPLRADIHTFIRDTQARAYTMNKKCRTPNNREHWIARGRQQALWYTSTQLRRIETTHICSYTLYLALHEYLECMEKYCLDGEEERHAVRPKNGQPREQWKAEGETQELARITSTLTHMVHAHTPDRVDHLLSLDGTTLVPKQ